MHVTDTCVHTSQIAKLTIFLIVQKQNINILKTRARVIPCQLSQPVNPPSQIFLKFNNHTELLMLIPTN